MNTLGQGRYHPDSIALLVLNRNQAFGLWGVPHNAAYGDSSVSSLASPVKSVTHRSRNPSSERLDDTISINPGNDLEKLLWDDPSVPNLHGFTLHDSRTPLESPICERIRQGNQVEFVEQIAHTRKFQLNAPYINQELSLSLRKS